MIKISCCQYQIEKLLDWNSYTSKIEMLVKQAKEAKAELLLLPEYAGVEIACQQFATDAELFIALQPLIPKYLEFYQNLSRGYQIHILAGTIIEAIAPQKYVNRAYLFSPNGLFGHQDKIQLTEFEKNIQLIQPGANQTVFETTLGKIGIAICYDSEFPEIVRRLVDMGAELILVPSYTSSIAGYNRVFLSCRARAIENQCYVAIAYVVDKVELSADVENTFGQAAVVGPADVFFPEDGVIAQGEMNKPMIIFANISFEKISMVRKQGHVLNFADRKRCDELAKNQINVLNLK